MAASLVVLYSTFSRSEAERVAALQPLLKHPPLTDAVETKVKQPQTPSHYSIMFHTEIAAAYPSTHVGKALHF